MIREMSHNPILQPISPDMKHPGTIPRTGGRLGNPLLRQIEVEVTRLHQRGTAVTRRTSCTKGYANRSAQALPMICPAK